jgi:hypothetical protein
MKKDSERFFTDYIQFKRSMLNILNSFELQLRAHFHMNGSPLTEYVCCNEGAFKGVKFPKLPLSSEDAFQNTPASALLPNPSDCPAVAQRILITRLQYVFGKQNISTIYDLLSRPEAKILAARDMGSKSVSLLRKCLEINNLRLGMFADR